MALDKTKCLFFSALAFFCSCVFSVDAQDSIPLRVAGPPAGDTLTPL